MTLMQIGMSATPKKLQSRRCVLVAFTRFHCALCTFMCVLQIRYKLRTSIKNVLDIICFGF
jgi:hypothetical protein